MPRPGPRPYECVRRAWHSDRHQPIRGSIIQQILRVVNGRHSTVTKKNREWQEKLPIVVFKAEEIMYSKANSEVEYMDLETLWDRANEAINIIIRRDESTESGELLPPCVEAALNLGCVPVRASRSQRHNNPRRYLNPRTSVPPKMLDKTITSERNPTSLPLCPASQSTDERPSTVNLSHPLSESNRSIRQISRSDLTVSCNFYEKFSSPRNNQFISVEGNTSVKTGHVYPLYSATHFQPEASRPGIQTLKNSNTIIVGTPVFPLVTEPAEMGCLKKLFSCEGNDNALYRISHSDSRDNHEKAYEGTECDLSLRLGLFSDPCLSRGKGAACDTDDIGQNNSQGGQLNELTPAQHKEFSFFPVETANDPIGFSTSSRNFEGEVQNAEAAVRKRKFPSNNNVGDGQFFWQPEPASNRFSGRMRRPGDERTEKTRNHKELKDKRHGTLNLQELNSICNLQPQMPTPGEVIYQDGSSRNNTPPATRMYRTQLTSSNNPPISSTMETLNQSSQLENMID